MEVVVFGRSQTQKNAFLRDATTILCKLNAFQRNDTDQILCQLGFERIEDWQPIEIGKYISGWKAAIKQGTK